MNLINIITRNDFLKKIYPNGIVNFLVGSINLLDYDRCSITLHSTEKPNIEIEKWGNWDKEYNVVVIELIVTLINKLNINNWNNNKGAICKIIVEELEGIYNIIFWGDNWKIELSAKSIVFQRTSTYLI